jgi:membrane fusion protein, heavy metal efflux system
MKLCILVLFTSILLAGCSKSEAPAPEKAGQPSTKEEVSEPPKDSITLDDEARKAIGVRVEEVKRAPIANTVMVTATVKPDETRVAHLKLLSRGRVTQLNVRPGDRVHSGQPLLSYDSIEAGELAAEYRSALAARSKAVAESELAKRSAERAESLVASGAIAKAEVERRSAEYKNAQASIDVARAKIDSITEKLNRFGLTNADLEKVQASGGNSTLLSQIVLRAPFDGVVTSSNAAAGEVIDTNQDVLTLIDISTVWVLGDVYERDLGNIRVGQQGAVRTDAYADQVFPCRVTYIADVIDSQTRTAKVRCEVANARDRLKLDMFAQIQFQASVTHDALVVPDSAVQTIDANTYVFIQKNESTFARTEVGIGIKTGRVVEITRGLSPGDMVVTEGSFALKSALLKDRIGGDEH